MRDLLVLDTTLRDGEQTPGASLSVEQKLLIAEALDNLGVDTIEAGTAIASEGDFNSIKEISELGLRAEVCSFARIKEEDIDAAAKAGANSIFMVAPSSESHIKSKLGDKSWEEVIDISVKAIEYAIERGLIVEFGGEDASRANLDFIKNLYASAVDVGAHRLTYTDTVGVLNPEKTENIMRELTNEFKVPMAIHCHNDFGLAVANSIHAIKGGASEIHGTVNGIGERAGNASLEEVVMALKKLYDFRTKIKTENITNTSKLVEKLTGIKVSVNKPIVGGNIFTHESGIHASAMLKDPTTYEPLSPEEVGRERQYRLGKLSGRAGVKAIVKELGYKTTDKQISEILSRIKEIGDKGKKITDADRITIIETVLQIKREDRVKLQDLSIVSGVNVNPTASVKIKIDGSEKVGAAVGVGPVDAAINAIKKTLDNFGDIELVSYHVDAITGGTDALVDVVVQLKRGEKMVTSRGARPDITMASTEAYIEGLNMLL